MLLATKKKKKRGTTTPNRILFRVVSHTWVQNPCSKNQAKVVLKELCLKVVLKELCFLVRGFIYT